MEDNKYYTPELKKTSLNKMKIKAALKGFNEHEKIRHNERIR